LGFRIMIGEMRDSGFCEIRLG